MLNHDLTRLEIKRLLFLLDSYCECLHSMQMMKDFENRVPAMSCLNLPGLFVPHMVDKRALAGQSQGPYFEVK